MARVKTLQTPSRRMATAQESTHTEVTGGRESSNYQNSVGRLATPPNTIQTKVTGGKSQVTKTKSTDRIISKLNPKQSDGWQIAKLPEPGRHYPEKTCIFSIIRVLDNVLTLLVPNLLCLIRQLFSKMSWLGAHIRHPRAHFPIPPPTTWSTASA